MKTFRRAIAVALSVVAMSSVNGAATVRGDDKFAPLDDLLRTLSRSNSLLKGSSTSCTSTVDCNLDVTVIPLYDKGGTQIWCAVKANSISISGGKSGDLTKITWTLKPPNA